MKKFSYKQSEDLCFKLNKFLEFVIVRFCGRCEGWTEGWAHGKKNEWNDKKRKWPHHNGDINKYISSKKQIESNLNKFFDDTEHGIFHGLMTSFCAFLLSSESKEDFEKVFSSCLLHDFVKSSDGLDAQKHDERLKEYFPDLLEETYVHNALADENSNSQLISADRLELMRYGDYKNWVDERFYLTFNRLSEKNKILIELFYLKVRPALEEFYKKRHSIWIRHGVEKLDLYEENFIYPKNYYTPKKIQKDSYPIEHDRFPFSPTGSYPKGTFARRLSLGFCSNHEAGLSWGKLKGFISLEDFKNENGIIINSKLRDHLYANSNIGIKKWTFIYQNLNLENAEAKCYNGDWPSTDHYSDKDVIGVLESILNINGSKIVGQDTVFLLWVVMKLATDRMTLLNLD